MRRINGKSQARASPSDNKIWVRCEKHEGCPLRKLIETKWKIIQVTFWDRSHTRGAETVVCRVMIMRWSSI